MMRKKNIWVTKSRRCRTKRSFTSQQNVSDEEVDPAKLSNEGQTAQIKVPSSALMPSRRAGDSPAPIPPPAAPVKEEPTDMEIDRTICDRTSPVENSCLPVGNSTGDKPAEYTLLLVKIKQEPVDSGYDRALMPLQNNTDKESSRIDNVEPIRKRIKTEPVEVPVSVTYNSTDILTYNSAPNGIKPSNIVAANQSGENSVTDNLSENVFNMDVTNAKDQNTTFSIGFVIKEEQEPAFADENSKKSYTDGVPVHIIKKEPEDKSGGSSNGNKLTKESKPFLNLNEYSTQSLSKILENVSRNTMKKSESPKNKRVESRNIAESAKWKDEATPQRASSSNSNLKPQLTPTNVAVGSLKNILHLDFYLRDVKEALEYFVRRPIKKANEILYPANDNKELAVNASKVSCAENSSTLANYKVTDDGERKVMDIISSMTNNIESGKITLSPTNSRVEINCSQRDMDVDRIVPSVTKSRSSHTGTSSEALTSVNLLKPVTTPFPEYMKHVPTSSKGRITAADILTSEQFEQILSSVLVCNKVPSLNRNPLASNSIAPNQIPPHAAAVSAANQHTERNPATPHKLDPNPSRDSVVNRPVGNLTTNLNRDHNSAYTPYTGNESTSFDPRFESSFRTCGMNTGHLNSISYRNNNLEINSIPPSSSMSQRTTSITQGTNIHNVNSSTHAPDSYENHNIRSSQLEVTSPTQSQPEATLPGTGTKRKVNVKEYLQRNSNKVSRPDNNGRQSGLECAASSIINSEMWNSAVAEFLANSNRDPRLRRNVACATTSNSAVNSVLLVPPTIDVNQSFYSRFPTLSDNITACDPPRAPVPSAASVVSSASVASSNMRNMQQFQPLPIPNAALNATPMQISTQRNKTSVSFSVSSRVLPSVSQSDQNSASSSSGINLQRTLIPVKEVNLSALQVTRDSNLLSVQFPPRRGTQKMGIDWHSVIGQKLIPTNDILYLIVEWNYQWLDKQKQTQACPRICRSYKEVKDSYESFSDYYSIYFPLFLLNIWISIYNAWNDTNCNTHTVTLQECIETNTIVKVSCGVFMDKSEIENFIKKEEIVSIAFKKGGEKDVLFGYVVSTLQRPDPTRKKPGLRDVQVNLNIAENLSIPSKSVVRITRLINMRVFLRQCDALLSLEKSPFRGIILRPKDHASHINIVSLPNGYDKMERDLKIALINTIVGFTEIPKRITLVNCPESIDRISFLSILVQNLIERQSTVLVFLKDRNSLLRLASNVLKYVIKNRFVLAVKPTEIKLPDTLVKYTLPERVQAEIGGRELTDNELFNLSANVLRESDVILTVLSCVFLLESIDAFTDSSITCIIDEATLCTETETILPLYYNVGHLVLIGEASKKLKVHPFLQKYGFQKSLYSRLYKVKHIT